MGGQEFGDGQEFGGEGRRPVRMEPAGFEFNRPTIISLCYLASAITGVSGLVGLVLAYVWRGEAGQAWETSHYVYLIRTFWLGLLGCAVGALLTLVLIGPLLILAVGVWVLVRCVLSLVNAQKRLAMPDPQTWKV